MKRRGRPGGWVTHRCPTAPRSKMKLTVVSVIAFFISTPVFAQESGAIGFGTVAEAYAALRKDAKAEFLIQEGWVIAKVTGGPHSGVWSFTPNTIQRTPL